MKDWVQHQSKALTLPGTRPRPVVGLNDFSIVKYSVAPLFIGV